MAQRTNYLANHAHMCAKAESHDWIDIIKSILYSNGFGYAWESQILQKGAILLVASSSAYLTKLIKHYPRYYQQTRVP